MDACKWINVQTKLLDRENFIYRLSQTRAIARRYVYHTFSYADIYSNDRDEHYFATSTSNNLYKTRRLLTLHKIQLLKTIFRPVDYGEN